MTDSQMPTEDQIEIKRYMESRLYRRAKRESNKPQWTPLQSLFGGAALLTAFLMLLAIVMVLTIWLMEEWLDRLSGYTWIMLLVQTICLPVLISFSFVTATAMFWYRSLLLRVLLGLAMTVPGFLAFMGSSQLSQRSFDAEMFLEAGACLLAQFMSAGTVALAMQFFSPWTLSPKRASDPAPIPPTGLWSFFELTLFFAVGFAFLIALNTDDLIPGLVFFGIWGAISTAAVIAVMIGSLREEVSTKAGWIVCAVFSFVCAAMINAFYATMLFSWDAAFQNIVLVAGVSLYGTAVMSGTFVVCINLLKHFDWTCVNRQVK